VAESVTSTDVQPQIRIYPLQYVKVYVAGVECDALNDWMSDTSSQYTFV